ncbi:MAG: MarR family transcriptional regulator [Planctomycetaceae bacterium]|nr:MarR family transcriptional regulator [Planctomycetaceae bacterium]
MTTQNLIPKDKTLFGAFEPKDVLIWLDGPRTFTLLDQDGMLCLAHWLQEVGELWQYVVVPVNESILRELNNGDLSLRDALNQPRVYLVNVNADFAVEIVYLTSWEDLPQAALPTPGTMIRRDLELYFRITSDEKAAATGLTVNEQQILDYMKDGQGHTLNDITTIVVNATLRSSIGRVLASLREKGLIESGKLT